MKKFEDLQDAYGIAAGDRRAILNKLESEFGIGLKDFSQFVVVNDAVDGIFQTRPGIVFIEGFFTALQLFRTELALVHAQLKGDANEHSN